MPKTDIKTMAALAEIVASIAVAVSLILVVVSLNQNTAALQSINDNFLYQLQDSRLSDVSNKDLSEVKCEVLFAASKGDTLVEDTVEITHKLLKKNPGFTEYIFDSGDHITLLSNKFEFRRMALDYFRDSLPKNLCPVK